MTIDPAAGMPADQSILVNVPKLVTAYYELRPDPSEPRQRVVFGTSGHRGSAMDVVFNEWHILAITFAERASGTEEICMIYAESFLGQDHLRQIQEQAQAIVSELLARSTQSA